MIVVNCRLSNICANWKMCAFSLKVISQNLFIILRLNFTSICRNVWSK